MLMNKKFSTKTVHAGEKVNEETGALTTPIYQTSTFGFKNTNEILSALEGKKYLYSRWSNPTVKALESKISILENGEETLAFGSGMAAISSTILTFLEKNDHVIISRNVYGGTFDFSSTLLNRLGIKVTFLNFSDTELIEKSIQENTQLIYFETPANPTMIINDIKKIVSISKENKIMTAVDSTFASPVNQNPLDMKVDLVLHSGTKYINGHSDILLGTVTGSKKLIDKIKETRTILGGVLDPNSAFLALKGVKTLDLRVKKQNQSAMKLAEFLEQNKKVNKVHYPGLKSNKYHKIATKQMRGYGGMLSFEVKGGLKNAKIILENLKICTLGASLGGVESLVVSPAISSHSAMPKKEREKSGIKDSLIRVSVGIEDEQDIINDFKQSLEKIS